MAPLTQCGLACRSTVCSVSLIPRPSHARALEGSGNETSVQQCCLISAVLCVGLRSCSCWTWDPPHKLRCTWWVQVRLMQLVLHCCDPLFTVCRLLKISRIDSLRKRYYSCWRPYPICQTVQVYSNPAPIMRHHTETADGHMTSHDISFSSPFFNINFNTYNI